MENNNNNATRMESGDGSGAERSSEAAGNRLQQEALTLYGCRDGSVVTDPAHCRPMNGRSLPNLSLEG